MEKSVMPQTALPWRVTRSRPFGLFRRQASCAKQSTQPHAYQVEIEHAGKVSSFEVGEGETILETALENGLELSHDCKMGVSGEVDQSAGMLDETAKEKGYTLLCVSEPRTDCRIKVIDEDEILEEVLCSSG